MKRLMVALLCSLFFASVTSADTATVNGITWCYSVSNGETGIEGVSGVSGENGAITVPEMLGGYPVTEIGHYAFYCCTSLTSVTIPKGCKIARGAFSKGVKRLRRSKSRPRS